ncbi:sodium/hydrogen exchanger family domain-containing protein [Ditylenchus destructor]|uniref:Sodium/hydrogen exchanger n=1 Tax=Ditylenchus destructor TaxID=166010 RepID=A0AAD4N828_9BILA|nr:sodium/hydrogen exchanger family domain-containing protein [Ditylenchus destructor]
MRTYLTYHPTLFTCSRAIFISCIFICAFATTASPNKESGSALFRPASWELVPDNDVVEQNGSKHNVGQLKEDTSHHEGHSVKVASFKFEYVKSELVLTFFIVVIGLFKLIYHQWKYPQAIVPESCCLIILGVLLGLFFFWFGSSRDVQFLEFDSKVFFFFLLPPIILEAAYSLNDRAFVDNLGTIVLYAVLGTVLNISIIGGFLVLFEWLGMFGTFGIHILDSLLFSSLIAAVDPVAVLSIFKEVGVNKMLYFMVFGESLLNDAVTVVCYNLVNEFKELTAITLFDCFLGLIAFLCVSLGGCLIGFIFGVLSSIITKHTIHVRVVEPVVCFGMAYLSYVCSELFHFSGIIGIICCGLFQTHYTMSNLSAKSQISINYITKVVSSVSESLIFIILGVMLVNERSWFWDDWHPSFSLYSLLLCIFARFLVVFVLTYVVNHVTGGVRYISFQEQIIMAYGGLRGAVSFSLAFMLSDEVDTKSTLLSATYVVILFTVFGQGCTIKFLVQWLNIRLAKKEDHFRLFNAFNKGMVNNMTQGIEDIIGVKDYTFMKHMSKLSRRYLRPYLQRNYVEKKTEDRLVMIETEENFKESLRSASSKPSLVRQQTIEDMSEQGSVTIDLYDEHQELMTATMSKKRKRTEETEKEVEELTKDTMQIQALFNGSAAFYPDRNLVDEDIRERSQSRNTYAQHLQRLKGLGDLSEVRKKKSLLGMRRAPRKKMSVTKGMLSVSAASLGVSHQPSSESQSLNENSLNHKITLSQKMSNASIFDKIQEVDETADSVSSAAPVNPTLPTNEQENQTPTKRQHVRFHQYFRHMDSNATEEEPSTPTVNDVKKNQEKSDAR